MTGASPFAVERDAWLSGALGQAAFRVTSPDEGAPSGAAGALLREPGLYTAKVPTERVAAVKALAAAGFSVVDVNVVLERTPEALPGDDGRVVRAARPGDKDAVLDIAGSCFRYSRFHLDPVVPRAAADGVKRAWMRSCLEGSRGDGVWVAEDGGAAAGFLAQLTAQEGTETVKVIDLIGVAAARSGRGIGRALVRRFLAEAVGRCARVRVGTQAANVPSLRLYESCGFRAAGSFYVLHAHVGRPA